MFASFLKTSFFKNSRRVKMINCQAKFKVAEVTCDMRSRSIALKFLNVATVCDEKFAETVRAAKKRKKKWRESCAFFIEKTACCHPAAALLPPSCL